eukprot:633107-Hanusia_phi.AAC.1
MGLKGRRGLKGENNARQMASSSNCQKLLARSKELIQDSFANLVFSSMILRPTRSTSSVTK